MEIGIKSHIKARFLFNNKKQCNVIWHYLTSANTLGLSFPLRLLSIEFWSTSTYLKYKFYTILENSQYIFIIK